MQAQLASLLVREAEQGRVRLSQQVLAALVGGRRTSVNWVLKDLEASAQLIERSHTAAREWLSSRHPVTGRAALLEPHRH